MRILLKNTRPYVFVFITTLYLSFVVNTSIVHAQEAYYHKKTPDFLYNDFACTVFLKDNTAIISAQRENSVYIYERMNGEWEQTEKLSLQDSLSASRFGHSISYDSDTLMIGAYANRKGGVRSGSVYVFDRQGSTWSETIKLYAI